MYQIEFNFSTTEFERDNVNSDEKQNLLNDYLILKLQQICRFL